MPDFSGPQIRRNSGQKRIQGRTWRSGPRRSRLPVFPENSGIVAEKSGLTAMPFPFVLLRSRRCQSGLLLAAIVAGGVILRGVAATPATGHIEYNRDIRPILSENCFLCHGPDKNTRKANLRLDLADEAVRPGKSGKVAIVPGKPGDSEVVRRLGTSDADDLMPPPETHKRITAEQRARIQRWISEGAVYQPHWAYVVPVRPPPPGVRGVHPIDAFVDAKLAGQGLKRSAEADRATLLRRLSLDLTGLPPTPTEVDAFVRDRSVDAYERQVERLLRSPHHGERMAVPWLDVVRYADTVGYHGDQNINVFPYREYVINAFNRNKRFDQFTREQLAGDLIPGAGDEARVATAFNRLNMVTREGGAQPKEYLAKYAADRVRTVAMTWLGSTMGCCECHDHKYDPFSTRDFYSMEAFFADVKQWGVYNDYDYTPNPDLKGWSNDHPFPPEIEVDSAYLRRKASRLTDAMAQWERQSAAAPGLEAWRRTVRTFVTANPDGWITPTPVPATNSTPVAVRADGSVVVGGDGAARNGEAVIRIPLAGLEAVPIAALRVELLPEGANGITLGGGSVTIRPGFKWVDAKGKSEDVAIDVAEATLSEPRYANGHELLGVQDGWKTSRARVREPQVAVWTLKNPRSGSAGGSLRVTLRTDQVQRFRVSLTPLANAYPLAAGLRTEWIEALKATEASSRVAQALAIPYLLGGEVPMETRKNWLALRTQWLECRGGRNPVVVTASWKPYPIHVLPRGNWQDESGEVVAPNPPRFLPRGGLPASTNLTRADLADWILSPANPLTARVFVNRLWKQFFGTGLSAQVDDLGAQGEWPTHPELLDWMAVEFRESGWDVRHLVRLIVTSGTYRQSANLRLELHDRDPNNRWLSSQNPRRLEAEFVRDNALAIAGLLDPEIGGPSAFPYQPGNYYANIQFPDRDYRASAGPEQYRRGLYSHWQRTFLHPMLANFDAPAREECTAARTVSNTPQQALTLLNDPTFVEASRAFAQRLLSDARVKDEARLRQAFRLALARDPKPAELISLTAFLRQQREEAAQQPADAAKFVAVGQSLTMAVSPVELAAWTQVARVVLNLHETVTRF